MKDLTIAALGGGHGLAATLTALRRITDHVTGIVTVADNGGSSGRLREEFGILPPGDLRMALAALCSDDEPGRTWAQILQHRFSGEGPLAEHALGNLLLAATWDQLGDHVAGLQLVATLLGAKGQVLPMAAIPLDIEADVSIDGVSTRVRGQVEVATTSGMIEHVRLHPAAPPACPQAVTAVLEADWVTIGPGSWFSSVMPTLLVPQLRDAVVQTQARRALILNLVGQVGETENLSPAEHLDVLALHSPDLRFDVVIADHGARGSDRELEAAAERLGAQLVCAKVADSARPDHHDPHALAAVLATVCEQDFPGGHTVVGALEEEGATSWP